MRRFGVLRLTPASAILLIIFAFEQVYSSGVFELKLQSFTNELAKDSEGKCCSGSRVPSAPGSPCPGSCRTYFRVCLKNYQAIVDPNPPCIFGDIVTPVLGLDKNLHISDTINVPGFTNPLKFPFEFSWPGTFSLVVEAWHEPSSTASSAGGAVVASGNSAASGQAQLPSTRTSVLISRLATQRFLDVGSNWTDDVHRTNLSSLRYAYRVRCDANYYGSGCAELCRPRDDRFGHFTCSPKGVKVCLPGYTGDYCATAVCALGCHERHGYCDVPNECKCRVGWQGKTCEQCIRYPGCVKGTCSEPWQCNCDEGWGGLFCNQDLNYCTNHKPCKGGGTCTNTGQGSYTCSCPLGYSGTDCEVKVDDCTHQPCTNGGTCKGSGSNYTCSCPVGYRGRHCELTTVTCLQQNSCRNGGTCEDGADGFVCRCPPGFVGLTCDQEQDDCSPSPCRNGGTCSDQLHGFTCRCPSGFAGDRCQVNVDDCETNPCQNSGSCMDQVNGYRCVCQPGFIGALCETNFDECLTKPCANGATCRDLVNGYRCECRPGFSGRDCSDSVDECASSPCRNGATCRDSHNEYRCLCAPGFTGRDCEQRLVVDDNAVDGHDDDVERNVSGLSRHVAAAVLPGEEDGLSSQQVVLIATLSAVVPLVALLSIVVILCLRRRRRQRRRQVEEEEGAAVGRDCAEDEEVRRQNEQNAGMHSMNNKCYESAAGSLVIVNTLDRKLQPASLGGVAHKGCYTNNKLVNEDSLHDRTKSFKHLNADVHNQQHHHHRDVNTKSQLDKDCDNKQQQIINKRTSLSIDVSYASPSDMQRNDEREHLSVITTGSASVSPAAMTAASASSPTSYNSSVYVIEEHCFLPADAATSTAAAAPLPPSVAPPSSSSSSLTSSTKTNMAHATNSHNERVPSPLRPATPPPPPPSQTAAGAPSPSSTSSQQQQRHLQQQRHPTDRRLATEV